MRSLGQFQNFFTKRFHTHKKVQNAHKRTKIKKAMFYALKNIKGEKSHLFAYLHFCGFAWLRLCAF